MPPRAAARSSAPPRVVQWAAGSVRNAEPPLHRALVAILESRLPRTACGSSRAGEPSPAHPRVAPGASGPRLGGLGPSDAGGAASVAHAAVIRAGLASNKVS
jgi:hypothetical protein